MSTLEPGTILQNRYRIVGQIGQGGMGAVYEALDERLGNRVALKQLLLAGDYLSRAFTREARILAHLSHGALPNVIDHFVEADGQFLVMQYIPGDDLAHLLAERGAPFPVEQVLGWGDQLLDALDYLHTLDPPVIHRDIKPHNLKLRGRNGIVLLDFGLAKGYSSGATQVSAVASIMGHTPGFAPPEQVEGTGTDARSDLFALGATLQQLLTNAAMPDALTRLRTVARRQADPLPLAHTLNPEVPPTVSAVLRQAMALDPDERMASAVAMRQALQAAARGELPLPARPAAPTQIEAPTVIPTPQVARPRRRAKSWPWTLLVGIALLGGLLVALDLLPLPSLGNGVPGLIGSGSTEANNGGSAVPTASGQFASSQTSVPRTVNTVTAAPSNSPAATTGSDVGGAAGQSSDAAALLNQGLDNYYKRNYDQAIRDYTQALQLDPRYDAAYNNRGLAYYDKGDYDHALQDYTQALQLNPRYPDAYNNRGRAYYEKQNYDQAIQDYTEAIQLNARYAAAYYNRGAVFKTRSATGDRARAIADFRKFLELNDDVARRQQVETLLRELGAP